MPSNEKKEEEHGSEETQLARKIQTAFQEKLSKVIELERIETALGSRERKGVTNSFATIESEGRKYLLRINGNLWPPYERQYEAKALRVLSTNGVKTGVLHNDDGFQICQKPDEDFEFSNILRKNLLHYQVGNILHLFLLELVLVDDRIAVLQRKQDSK